MNQPQLVSSYQAGARRAAVILVALAATGIAQADQPAGDAARLVTDTASLLRREKPRTPWHTVNHDEALPAGQMLIGLPGAAVQSKDVRLTFLSDLDGRSPYPVVESAIVLQPPHDVDLDFQLDRGRVDLQNHRANGDAHVRFHVRQETWELTLMGPGAAVALELYGRWARGVPFAKDESGTSGPTAELDILVLKGRVLLSHDDVTQALSAPPGPALMEWDSVTGQDPSPRRLEQLPPWAVPDENSPVVKEKRQAIERIRQAFAEKPVDQVVDAMLASPDLHTRERAIWVLGALDELVRLAEVLRTSRDLEIWDTGVRALRHWIGRAPGQDQKLYHALIEIGHVSPIEAEDVMELLHSYGEDDLSHPETYQTLIDYLGHDRLAVRGLAYWHLSRLVPAGKAFGYNPLDPPEARSAALRKWHALVPPGTVPAARGATAGESKK